MVPCLDLQAVMWVLEASFSCILRRYFDQNREQTRSCRPKSQGSREKTSIGAAVTSWLDSPIYPMFFADYFNVSFAGCSFRWAGFTSCVVFISCVGRSTDESYSFPDSRRDWVWLAGHPRAPRESKNQAQHRELRVLTWFKRGAGRRQKNCPHSQFPRQRHEHPAKATL